MLNKNVLSQIDQKISEMIEEAKIPGLCIGIISNNKLAYTRGFGVRDTETKLPVNSNTLFGVGSCTKIFISLAILQLSESGKLSIEDPVNKHIPLELGYEDNPIRIKHLMSHISGIPNLGIDKTLALSYTTVDDKRFPIKSKSDFYNFINKTSPKIVKHPETEFNYFNAGFTLLGEVIEAVSGMKLEKYIQENILKPLGMRRSTFLREEYYIDENISSFYILEDDAPSKKKFLFNPFIFAPGGLMSSVEEFSSFLIMLMNNGKYKNRQIVSKDALNDIYEIKVETPLSEPGRHGYSAGLAISDDFLGYKLISHGGSIHISSAHFAIIPELKLGVVSFANIDNGTCMSISQLALKSLIGKNTETKSV